ncbi:hypothetical protein AVEN_191112-1 [Araneus ventricosus]|uniref:Integrase catalytic domain-containing protein n=1 Tax=Araneus ventricosus TaxID=182803 RepID=A0A4Y2B0N6_ARAVE|nr:hypothetical protein AVEN_191112-1 [Araneus ventricosus]
MKGSMVADRFRSEQERYADLEIVWNSAKEGKDNYYEVDGYFFHKDKILGKGIGQLWGEAIQLTSLKAKAPCEGLLSIFYRMGIPNVMVSDNGAKVNAELTKDFEKRIGNCPGFSTPAYPQFSELVERFSRTEAYAT